MVEFYQEQMSTVNMVVGGINNVINAAFKLFQSWHIKVGAAVVVLSQSQ